jgi:hypothetical protein
MKRKSGGPVVDLKALVDLFLRFKDEDIITSLQAIKQRKVIL